MGFCWGGGGADELFLPGPRCRRHPAHKQGLTMSYFCLEPTKDNFNQELQICIAEALYDVDSIVADPGAYTKEELASLHSQIVSNLEQVLCLCRASS